MICTQGDRPLSQQYMQTIVDDFSSLLKSKDMGISPQIRQWEYAMAMKYVKPSKHDIVLDIGCGATNFIIFIAHYVSKVFGIDIGTLNEVGIEQYLSALTPSDNYYSAWLNSLSCYEDFNSGKVEVVTQNARMLPFPDEYFDKVYSFSALQGFEDDDDTLCSKEVFRVLKPGGRFCGTVDFNILTEKPLGENDPRRTYTHDAFLRRIVKPPGFMLLGREDRIPIPKTMTNYHWRQIMFFALVKV